MENLETFQKKLKDLGLDYEVNEHIPTIWIEETQNEEYQVSYEFHPEIYAIMKDLEGKWDKAQKHVVMNFKNVDKSKYEYHTLIRCITQITYVIIKTMSMAS